MGTGLAAGTEGDAALRLGEAGRTPDPWQSDGRQAFGKDAARTLGSGAPEATNLEMELADTALPRKVAEAANIVAVNAA